MNRQDYYASIIERCKARGGTYKPHPQVEYRLCDGALERRSVEEVEDRFVDGISRHRWTDWEQIESPERSER